MDKTTIKKIKDATVAIGLVKKGVATPFEIHGTGVIIHPSGYTLTAAHVAESCTKSGKSHNKNGTDVELAVFRAISSKNKINFETDPQEKFTILDLIKIPDNMAGPSDLDVACGKPKTIRQNLPYLSVKTPQSFGVGDEISICGYPRGEHSLSLKAGKFTGIRFSPSFQSGKISGMMPIDDDTLPYGIQTDIIGTAGSSGSPITDVEGNVIGIAQKVIPSIVMNGNDATPLSAKVGLIYGITSTTFSNFVSTIDDYFQKGKNDPVIIPITTLDIPEFKRSDS